MVERHYRVLWLCLVCLSIIAVGCSPKEEKKKPVPPLPPTSIKALQMDVDDSDLTDKQDKLLKQINNDKVKNDALVDAFVELHSSAFATSGVATTTELIGTPIPSAMKAMVESLARKANVNQADQMELKLSLDSAIEDELGEILYNKAHISFYSYFEKNRMQCFSGTSLYEVIRHLRSGYSGDMAVVIFESGHVLPGYMKRIGRSNRFELIGMETTVIGGKKDYGPADELEFDVRVIEADFFLATEIFEEKIQNMQQVFNNALEITASKYGIPLVQIEEGIPQPVIAYEPDQDLDVDVASLQASFSDRINRSMFAFGSSSHVPAGDRERPEIDELTPRHSGSAIASGQVSVSGLTRRSPSPEGEGPIANRFCGSAYGDQPFGENTYQDQSFGFQMHSHVSEGLADLAGESRRLSVQIDGPGQVFVFSNEQAYRLAENDLVPMNEGSLFLNNRGAFAYGEEALSCYLKISGPEFENYGFIMEGAGTSESEMRGLSSSALFFAPSGPKAYIECEKRVSDPRDGITGCELEQALAPLGLMTVLSEEVEEDSYYPISF